ncbi:hypothetical protein C481_00510 [Natrialba asiatica DSM 12278]|uniref:Uncharacterized protein n=1 Tax=Natrialba asiatica (strain ATCC 700177 / DSM 12278 / JCM 9576 / FERM P-10747 / NBRC 102637 / 172P1) TaxID=29540 RepID=M0B591_NATA1|nr:hypothetical protein C481_00510 [Natrialba asiatica DSM 12278]
MIGSDRSAIGWRLVLRLRDERLSTIVMLTHIVSGRSLFTPARNGFAVTRTQPIETGIQYRQQTD